MAEITVAVLTVSDRCSRNEAVDESGPALVEMIESGMVKGAKVVKTCLLPDDKDLVANQIKRWCDEEKIGIVLTTGGTGLGPRDATPEATAPLIEKLVPGIPMLTFKRSSEVTPLAALSRGLAGVRGNSLIVNLPGSKKAVKECFEAIACVLTHAADLVSGREEKVRAAHLCLGHVRKSSVKVAEKKARQSPFPCVKVADAQDMIISRIYLLRKECAVRLEDARGFVLTQDAIAMNFLPPYDASLMDGYAVKAPYSGTTLSVIGYSHSGTLPGSELVVTKTSCLKISTGAPLPNGANAVIPIENTTDLGDSIQVRQSVSPMMNVRPKGHDFKPGELLLKRESCLDSAALGLLAAAGITSLRVFAKPTTALISTGNELVEPGIDRPAPGKIRDSNRITLANMLKEEGFLVVDLGIVKDEPDALCDALDKAFRKADVVVTTGSMSMGDRDYMKEILVDDFGAEICFGRVKMKPGKPTAFAFVPFEGKTKIWFGLPGNPASAAVTAHLFVLPAMRKISGQVDPFPEALTAVLVGDKVILEERPNYQRGVLSYDAKNNRYNVKTTGIQDSSRLASCVGANCLVVFPEKTSSENFIEPGTWVRVLRLK